MLYAVSLHKQKVTTYLNSLLTALIDYWVHVFDIISVLIRSIQSSFYSKYQNGNEILYHVSTVVLIITSM